MDTVRPWQAAVECVVTAGGEHNVWFVGDETDCAVIDPAGDVGDLVGRCELRRLRAILWTTLWPGSVGTGLDLADRTGAVTYLPTDDLVIWRKAEAERAPQSSVPPGLVLSIGGVRLESIHTPGITAGALCWYAPALSVVFTGRTLLADGSHGSAEGDRTVLSGEDHSTLKASIRTGLFSLPSQTVVHPGSGVDTRIGTQRWDRRLWG